MKMEMSEKDKNLLYILVAIVILVAAYYFGYSNFNNKKAEYLELTEQYNSEYNTLIELQKDKNKYIEDTQKFLDDADTIYKQYNNGFIQENLIKTLTDKEEENLVFLKNIGFNEPEVIYSFASREGAVGVKTDVNLNYEGDYEGFKSYISNILNFDSKTTINQMNASWNETDEFVDISVNMSHYGVDATDMESYIVAVEGDLGLGNIFVSNSVYNGPRTDYNAGMHILSDYDISVLLSQPDADIDAIIVGTTNDAKAKDSLSTDDNEEHKLVITVDGKEGKYTVAYKLDDKTYPSKNYEKGVELEPGNTLDVLVKSCARAGATDKATVKAEIINNSDMKLNMLIADDDKTTPRFSVTKKTGDITIYK